MIIDALYYLSAFAVLCACVYRANHITPATPLFIKIAVTFIGIGASGQLFAGALAQAPDFIRPALIAYAIGVVVWLLGDKRTRHAAGKAA